MEVRVRAWARMGRRRWRGRAVAVADQILVPVSLRNGRKPARSLAGTNIRAIVRKRRTRWMAMRAVIKVEGLEEFLAEWFDSTRFRAGSFNGYLVCAFRLLLWRQAGTRRLAFQQHLAAFQISPKDLVPLTTGSPALLCSYLHGKSIHKSTSFRI